MQTIQLNTEIPFEMAGKRLDQVLVALFPDYSRARWQEWIKEGFVQINSQTGKPKDKVHGGEIIDVNTILKEVHHWQAQDLPLNILFEDEELLVIDKPAGLVVHPGAGNPDQTLLNAILHHAPELSQIPRAGIIHRLDKDTSGVLVISKTLFSHNFLVAQLQERAFIREYHTVVTGLLTAGGSVDAQIGRHPVHRTQMAVVSHNGRPAITHYRLLERFRVHTYVQVRLETGRTHQIRVHFAHIRFPVVGDPVYGGRLRLPPQCTDNLRNMLENFPRQALHAARLGILHPRTQQPLEWLSPIPEDMSNLIKVLRDDRDAHQS
jgi:23S rRNA pseudouridine1911/1915/1917 synthase